MASDHDAGCPLAPSKCGSKIVRHPDRERLRAGSGETAGPVTDEAYARRTGSVARDGAAGGGARAVLAVPGHSVAPRPQGVMRADAVAHVGIAQDHGRL